MKISVVQSKSTFGYDQKNPGDYTLEKCLMLSQQFMGKQFELIERALAEGSKLVVTIEGFNESVSPKDKRYDYSKIAEPLNGPLIKRFGELSKKYEAYIVAGLYTMQNKKVYNSAVLLGPTGEVVGVHNKVHLPAGEEVSVTHGDKFEVFETPYGNIGMLVCWDLQFPESARELALLGADIIACPTWGCEFKYVPCRAYENSVTLAVAMGVPYDGDIWEFCDPSCIVDNMGNIVAVGGKTHSEIVSAEIDIKKEPIPQYGSENFIKSKSMRHTRLLQRRPETYKEMFKPVPKALKRYKTL